MRPDRFRGVVGLSVPFRPRGKVRPTSAMPRTENAQFYQLYFQEPGPADAEFERDPRLTIRSMLFGASGEGAAAARAAAASGGAAPSLGMVPKGGGFLQGPGAPAALPGWITESDHRFLRGRVQAHRLPGALNWYRNFDRNWELQGSLQGARSRFPRSTSRATATSWCPLPAWISFSPISNTSCRICAAYRCFRAAVTGPSRSGPNEVNAAIIDFVRSLPG